MEPIIHHSCPLTLFIYVTYSIQNNWFNLWFWQHVIAWWKGRDIQGRRGYLIVFQNNCEKCDWTWWRGVWLAGRNEPCRGAACGGKADTAIRTLRNGGERNERLKFHFTRLHKDLSWSTRPAFQQVGVAIKELGFWRGGAEVGWDCVSLKHCFYNSLVLRSQPVQFTYILLPLS